MSRALLLLACSATKRDQSAAAIELYDGPAYQIARKRLYPVRGGSPRTVILSAEHGLISAERFIAPYDRRMDDARADELAAADEAQIRETLYLPFRHQRLDRQHFGPYSRVFAFGGDLYRRVFEAWRDRGIFDGAEVTCTRGGIGEQLGQLAAWLDQETASNPQSPPRAAAARAPHSQGA